jgi:hypothetical protein
VDEELQMWRVTANILNRQSQTADKRWYSSLEVARAANNSALEKKKSSKLQNMTQGLRHG